MALKYYKFINSLVKISFDQNEDPDFCEIYDPREHKFVRRNEILDDVLNHFETEEISQHEFSKKLSVLERQPAP